MEQRRVLLFRVRLALFLVSLLPSLLAAGCRSQERREPVDPRFTPAMLGLERAVEAGDDETARRILAGILARSPEGRTRDLADTFGLLLEGRALGDQLELVLEAEPLGEPPGEPAADAPDGRYRLALFCSNRSTQELELRLPPPTLELLAHWVYVNGSDARSVEERALDGLGALALAPGETVRVDLGEFSADPGTAMARRDLWRMRTRSGELVVGGRHLPLRAPEVRSCEVVGIASYLPQEPVEPEQLLEYVRRPRISMAGLLERSIRIPPSRWNETLERLEPVAGELSDSRLAGIAPALRWLSRSPRLGRDASSWRHALSTLTRDSLPHDPLDLPDPLPASRETETPTR